jgi:hypothetical protein
MRKIYRELVTGVECQSLGLTLIQELLDPAIVGTTGILQAIKNGAPSVKKVVVTSSFAAVNDPSKGNWPEHTYSEADWNPMTLEDALLHPARGYTGTSTAILQGSRKTGNFLLAHVRVMMRKSSDRLAASKAFAEKAAWDFVEKEKPSFSLSTINPSLVFGPIVSLPR